jgi:hypothetical protein
MLEVPAETNQTIIPSKRKSDQSGTTQIITQIQQS